jgi:hypothetical protein
MGKKKRNKLRKILREQAIEHNKLQAVSTISPTTSDQPQPDQIETAPVADAETVEVRGEIRKILITVGVLILLVVAVYLANIKTDFILKLGAWLSRVLNINV